MYNITIYESLSEKINLIRKEFDDDIDLVKMKLHIHHGAPVINELRDMKDIEELIHTPTKYIDIWAHIIDNGDGECVIRMRAEKGSSMTPKDIEDVIYYLHSINIIKKIDKTIDLQDENTIGDLRYSDQTGGAIRIHFCDVDERISTCWVLPNTEIKLQGYYDPTILLGLSRVAHNFIFRDRK